MNQLLRDLINELHRLNDFLGGKVFSKKKIAEEEQNLTEVFETQKKLNVILKKIQQCPLENEEQFCDVIIDLHVLTNNLAWYFENINENVNMIIQNYPFSKQFKMKNSLNNRRKS